MQTFKQFLEARDVKDIKTNSVFIISNYYIKNPITCIEFALYCAEDCFQFNNEETRPLAQQCINLIRKWLKKHKSVKTQELESASFHRDINHPAARNALRTAQSACLCIARENIVYYLNDVLYGSAITFAYASGNRHSSSKWQQIRDQKLQEYIRKLKSLTTTRSGHSTSIEPLKGYDNSYVTIMAALDNLEEIGEIGKEHFVYQDGNEWVFDLGHDNILRADSREALATLIHNDKYYLNALMRLYNANV